MEYYLFPMIEKEEIRATCPGFLAETTAFLDRLVRFESVSGYEGPAIQWLYEQFKGLADVCEKVVVTEAAVLTLFIKKWCGLWKA